MAIPNMSRRSLHSDSNYFGSRTSNSQSNSQSSKESCNENGNMDEIHRDLSVSFSQPRSPTDDTRPSPYKSSSSAYSAMSFIPCRSYHVVHTMSFIPCRSYHVVHIMSFVSCRSYHALSLYVSPYVFISMRIHFPVYLLYCCLSCCIFIPNVDESIHCDNTFDNDEILPSASKSERVKSKGK
jgi:hypothetical protein